LAAPGEPPCAAPLAPSGRSASLGEQPNVAAQVDSNAATKSARVTPNDKRKGLVISDSPLRTIRRTRNVRIVFGFQIPALFRNQRKLARNRDRRRWHCSKIVLRADSYFAAKH
jgi:hypothetical protein